MTSSVGQLPSNETQCCGYQTQLSHGNNCTCISQVISQVSCNEAFKIFQPYYHEDLNGSIHNSRLIEIKLCNNKEKNMLFQLKIVSIRLINLKCEVVISDNLDILVD